MTTGDNSSTLTSHWSGIDDLAPRDLYAMLKLRVDVFVVEQKCPYPEIDGRDVDALHLRLLDGDHLAASLRVLPPEAGDPAVHIGRVVVSPTHRGQKLGQRLMGEAVAFCQQRFPGAAVELSAQSHLLAFYASFGFVGVSDEYLDAGVPHVDMRLKSPEDER